MQRVQQLDKTLLTLTPVSTTGIPPDYTGKPNSVFVYLYLCAVISLISVCLDELSVFQ